MISSISAHPGAAWSFSKALLKAACSGSGVCFCPREQRASIRVLILPYTFVPLTSCVSIYQTSYFALALHVVTFKGCYQTGSFKIVSWQPTGSYEHLELSPHMIFNLPFTSSFSSHFSHVFPANKKQLAMLLMKASLCNPQDGLRIPSPAHLTTCW